MNPSYYSRFQKHYLAIDCVIYGFTGEDLEVLLIKRNYDPGKGEWALPGGFLDESESLEEASQRLLMELTGLKDVYLEQFRCFGEIERDPGARVITVGYYALIRINEYDEFLVKEHHAYWKKISDLPPLMFDHLKITSMALSCLQDKARVLPVGFELLPEKFTLPQLQKLYEAIFQTEFDKRNFRKKILSMGFIQRLNEKDKSSSKKGAFLHRFQKEKFSDLKTVKNSLFLFGQI
jgi:8-oxo-dGTP diphosphatase